jgi:hypothetical protein
LAEFSPALLFGDFFSAFFPLLPTSSFLLAALPFAVVAALALSPLRFWDWACDPPAIPKARMPAERTVAVFQFLQLLNEKKSRMMFPSIDYTNEITVEGYGLFQARTVRYRTLQRARHEEGAADIGVTFVLLAGWPFS